MTTTSGELPKINNSSEWSENMECDVWKRQLRSLNKYSEKTNLEAVFVSSREFEGIFRVYNMF